MSQVAVLKALNGFQRVFYFMFKEKINLFFKCNDKINFNSLFFKIVKMFFMNYWKIMLTPSVMGFGRNDGAVPINLISNYRVSFIITITPILIKVEQRLILIDLN